MFTNTQYNLKINNYEYNRNYQLCIYKKQGTNIIANLTLYNTTSTFNINIVELYSNNISVFKGMARNTKYEENILDTEIACTRYETHLTIRLFESDQSNYSLEKIKLYSLQNIYKNTNIETIGFNKDIYLKHDYLFINNENLIKKINTILVTEKIPSTFTIVGHQIKIINKSKTTTLLNILNLRILQKVLYALTIENFNLNVLDIIKYKNSIYVIESIKYLITSSNGFCTTIRALEYQMWCNKI